MLALLLAACALGCATPYRDRAWVSDQLVERAGHGLGTAGGDDRWSPESLLAGGLDEDEAVEIELS